MKENDDVKYEAEYDQIFDNVNTLDNAASVVLKNFWSVKYKSIIISMILYVIKHSPVLVMPIGIAEIINISTNPSERSLPEMYVWVGILSFLVLQNLYTNVVYIQYTGKILRSYGASVRNLLVKKLQQLSLNGQKRFESGKLQSKFIRDIENIEAFLSKILKSLIPTVMIILITSTITIVKNPMVALFFLLVIPVNILLVRLFRRNINSSHSNFRKSFEEVSTEMSSMIEMLSVTKGHGLEDVEIRKMKRTINDLKEAGLSLDYIDSKFGASAWVVSTLLSTLCLAFTGVLAYKGKIPVGDVILYQTNFNIITNNVQSLLNMVSDFAKGVESIKSVSEIVISDNVENNRGKINLRYVYGAVQFNNVSYKYPYAEEYAIKNFSLKVEPGECIAVVGESGSGKTTIMNMIIGFIIADKGELLIDGKPINTLNLKSYRHFLSVVPQNCILFAGTIRENIVYGCENISEERIWEVVELANIKEFIEELPDGLDTHVAEHGGNLSGGQKQRISIARALIRNPKIIIFDEATSALDNISEYRIQQAMTTLIKGRTTFIVAHRLSTIRNADKIVVMSRGECVEFGTYDELMEKKDYFYRLKTMNDLNA